MCPEAFLRIAGNRFQGHDDASAVGSMLVAMLNRFARQCSHAEDQLEHMRRQNSEQQAEMQELKERVKMLEASLPPIPRLATPPYNDRGLRAPPSTPHLRQPVPSDVPAEAATIESGRVVRMMGGERPRELYTARRTGPVPNAYAPTSNGHGPILNGRAELERAGLERTYVGSPASLSPRRRRPPSPKPPPNRSVRYSPTDAPPLPARSITSPEIHRVAAR